MSTRTVSFKAPEDMIDTIDQAVEEGNYTSRGEFLRDVLRNIEIRPLSEEAKDRIQKGRQDDPIPLDEL